MVPQWWCCCSPESRVFNEGLSGPPWTTTPGDKTRSRSCASYSPATRCTPWEGNPHPGNQGAPQPASRAVPLRPTLDQISNNVSCHPGRTYHHGHQHQQQLEQQQLACTHTVLMPPPTQLEMEVSELARVCPSSDHTWHGLSQELTRNERIIPST